MNHQQFFDSLKDLPKGSKGSYDKHLELLQERARERYGLNTDGLFRHLERKYYEYETELSFNDIQKVIILLAFLGYSRDESVELFQHKTKKTISGYCAKGIYRVIKLDFPVPEVQWTTIQSYVRQPEFLTSGREELIEELTRFCQNPRENCQTLSDDLKNLLQNLRGGSLDSTRQHQLIYLIDLLYRIIQNKC